MYNPCFECLNRYGKQYTEECDKTCEYAHVLSKLKLYGGIDEVIKIMACIDKSNNLNTNIDYMSGIKTTQCCPHCGKSYYRENYSKTTAMYCPPIYKDGIDINPDKNKTTTYCTCMNCGKDFSFNN